MHTVKYGNRSKIFSHAIAALVTAIITISLPLIFNRMFPGDNPTDSVNQEFNQTKMARSEAINGRWQGTAYQNDGPHGKPVEFKFDARFLAKGIAVSGKATIDHNNEQYQLDLEGRFINVYVVELSYINIDPTVVHFGKIIVELSSFGNEWIAKFINYGLLSKAIASGTLKCRRISR